MLLRTGRNFDSGIFVLNIYFCVSYVFVLILIMSSFNNFLFCFSNSGWAVGPSGGIVEPDLVTRMRLDESADGHFFFMVLLWAFSGNRLSTSAICSATASITTVSRT